jgi:hypothetical protein
MIEMEGEKEIRSLLILVADPDACKHRLEALTAAYNIEREAKDEASLVKKQVELSKQDNLKIQEQLKQDRNDLRAATLEHDRRRGEAETTEASAQHAIDTLRNREQTLDHREALLFRREQELKNK